ncbi:hypothetical protein ACJMK2_034872, partial [Sinanodonta woodiana]
EDIQESEEEFNPEHIQPRKESKKTPCAKTNQGQFKLRQKKFEWVMDREKLRLIRNEIRKSKTSGKCDGKHTFDAI